MKWMLAIICILPMAMLALAQPVQGERLSEVSLARNNAVSALRQQILQEIIRERLTVGQFLEQVGGSATLDNALHKAEQLGGPRWIDDRICQVRLEISGLRVATALVQTAQIAGNRSPISAGDLQVELSVWRNRSYSATGTSLSAGALPDAVLQNAKTDAVQKSLTCLKTVKLPGGKTIDDALANPEARKDFSIWLANHPVDRLQLRENDEVALGIVVAPNEISEWFRRAFDRTGDASVWSGVAPQVESAIREVVGVARIGSANDPAKDWRNSTEIPTWVNDRLEAEGFSPSTDARLKTARLAEVNASQALRDKLLALPIKARLTMAQAGKSDPELAQAIDRMLLRARLTKTEYHPDGSVTVRLFLDLNGFWDQIHEAR